MLDSLNGVYCSLKPIAEAKQDPSHPLHYLARQVILDGHFVKALHEMYMQFSIFTDFFDMKHNWQVKRYCPHPPLMMNNLDLRLESILK